MVNKIDPLKLPFKPRNNHRDEAAISDSFVKLARASNAVLDLNIENELELTSEEFTSFYLFNVESIVGDGSLWLPRNVFGNPLERVFAVRNATSQTLTLRDDDDSIIIKQGEQAVIFVSTDAMRKMSGEPNLGYLFISNTNWTEESPLTLTPDPLEGRVRYELDILDGSFFEIDKLDQLFNGHKFIDAEGCFQPFRVWDLYEFRLNMVAKAITIGGYVEVTLDLTGEAIAGDTHSFVKESGTPHLISIDSKAFAGTIFVENGAKFIIETDTNIDLYNITLLIAPGSLG